MRWLRPRRIRHLKSVAMAIDQSKASRRAEITRRSAIECGFDLTKSATNMGMLPQHRLFDVPVATKLMDLDSC